MKATACLLFGLLSVVPGLAQQMNDPAEYKAFMDNVYNVKDPVRKVAGAEKFLSDYPKSVMQTQTYMEDILLGYYNVNSWSKALETAGSSSAAVSGADAPSMIFPQHGQTLGLPGAYLFSFTTNGEGFECSLRQDGAKPWQMTSSAPEGECGLYPDDPAHGQFHSGPATFAVRQVVDGVLSMSREITINLVGSLTIK